LRANQDWHQEQSLDDWHEMFFAIYGLRNSERDEYNLFAHLVEVVGGISKGVRRRYSSTDIVSFAGKLIAWYSALASRLNYRSISSLIWNKYPAVCPRCCSKPCACDETSDLELADHSTLRKFARQNIVLKPTTITEWQDMFFDLFPGNFRPKSSSHPGDPNPVVWIERALLRLNEELAELGEAIRLGHVYPTAIPMELPDVFAWIMAISNILPEYLGDHDFNISSGLWTQYPGCCTYCWKAKCQCPNDRVRPSLISSIGLQSGVYLDGLTKLPLKDSGERDLAIQLGRANDARPTSILLIDLDKFKNVNDTLGHTFGDAVLRNTAGIIQKTISTYNGSSYRWGGEEFLAILPDRSEEEAVACGERIRTRVKESKLDAPNGGKYFQTISLGVTTVGEAPGIPIPVVSEEAMRIVDEALYSAKGQGRDKCVFAQYVGGGNG